MGRANHGVNGYKVNGYGYEEQFPCQFLLLFWVHFDRVTHGVDGMETMVQLQVGTELPILFPRFSKLRLKTEINPVL